MVFYIYAHEQNLVCVARQHGGKSGIGDTCGAERGKLRHLRKWVTTSEETKKRAFDSSPFSVIMYLFCFLKMPAAVQQKGIFLKASLCN